MANWRVPKVLTETSEDILGSWPLFKQTFLTLVHKITVLWSLHCSKYFIDIIWFTTYYSAYLLFVKVQLTTKITWKSEKLKGLHNNATLHTHFWICIYLHKTRYVGDDGLGWWDDLRKVDRPDHLILTLRLLQQLMAFVLSSPTTFGLWLMETWHNYIYCIITITPWWWSSAN